jgi:Tfp pilus assembly protein PilX
MLVVIGLTSAAVMRGVLNTDLVSENSRRQAQAMQAAQAALRYCENQVLNGSQTPAAAAATVAAENWQTWSNWSSTDTAISRATVTQAYLTGGSTDALQHRYASGKAPLPECMAQYRSIAGGDVVVITSRGFSDDYRAKSDDDDATGAVVWLQSIIQLSAEDS